MYTGAYLLWQYFECALTEKACLKSRGHSQPLVSHRHQSVVASTFNPSTREVETGSDMVTEQRKEDKAGGDREFSPLDLRIW